MAGRGRFAQPGDMMRFCSAGSATPDERLLRHHTSRLFETPPRIRTC
jgi:hypothetical protein